MCCTGHFAPPPPLATLLPKNTATSFSSMANALLCVGQMVII